VRFSWFKVFVGSSEKYDEHRPYGPPSCVCY